MPTVGLTARVVEVIADRGAGVRPRYRHASGCVVAGRTVLTAAHVVAGAKSVSVRDPAKVTHETRVDPAFIGDADGPGPDLALVEVPGLAVALPPIPLARVDRDSATGDPVPRCHTIGYPQFMESQTRHGISVRDTVDACGQVPVLSGLARGLLSVQVSSAPRALPPGREALAHSPWSGMSGAPVIADGYLLGVVTEHAPRVGTSTITATPLTALHQDPAHENWGAGVADPPAWWARLGVSGLADLTSLPVRPRRVEPAYLATVQEIHRRTPLLVGRHRELADLVSFATGADGYRWLVGGAYAGKTSLLAEAAAALPPEVDVVCYFLSRREADADSARFLAAVVPQLSCLLDEDPPTAGLHEFRALWQRAAERANETGRHLLLVVDGLDEDLRPPGLPSVAAVLPTAAGGRTHVLVGSRPYPQLPADVPPGHRLNRTTVPVQPFAGSREQVELARREIDHLVRGDDGLGADVFGLLTAAAGPLTVADLADLVTATAESPAALRRRIRRLLTHDAARTVQPVGPIDPVRFQFAHDLLLTHARAHDDLNDPEFRGRIHRWAQSWRDAGWPVGDAGTPRYLLDAYPSTLATEPQRLTALVSDPGWVEAAIRSVGVDHVLTDLRRATAATPETAVAAMCATVAGQAHHLRAPRPLNQPGYVLRQLWQQAAELGNDLLAHDLCARLRSQPSSDLVPRRTTRRSSHALWGELGHHHGPVWAVAVLPDGRVVSGSDDGRVLVWDPAGPGDAPVELGRHDDGVEVVAGLPDGRVVSGGSDGRVLVWYPSGAGGAPVELGRYHNWVSAVAVLPDGRVVSGGDRRVLVWDPSGAGGAPVELGRHKGSVWALAVLPDGRMVSGGGDGRVLVWELTGAGGAPVEVGRHDGLVGAVAGLPDGRVVSGGGDGRVLMWDPSGAGGAPVELGRHDDGVEVVAGLPDGRVVSGGIDGRVLVWELTGAGGAPVEVGRHDDGVEVVAGLPDGRVVSGGIDGLVAVWDPSGAGGAPVELGHHDGVVWAVAVLPDGRVVSGGDDGLVAVWDPSDAGGAPVELGRDQGGVRAVAVLPDGRVVSGGDDGLVAVWDPSDAGGAPVELGRHKGSVWAVAVLPDGRVVSGGDDRRVLVWDVMTRTVIAELACSVTALATAPLSSTSSALVIAHQGNGLSVWSFNRSG